MTCKDIQINTHENRSRDWFVIWSVILFLSFMIGAWAYIIYVEEVTFKDVFSQKNLDFASKFLKRLIYDGQNKPAYLQGEEIVKVAGLMIETLKMSVMAIVFSTLGMFITMIPIMVSVIKKSQSPLLEAISKGLTLIIHLAYLISRAVPELIWAMMLIFIFRPGILPGALALGLHNFGILGKLCFEVVENMDHGPLQAIAGSGGDRRQTLIYGVLPLVSPKFISYIIYRWEVILRTTIVVGMVGAGGLGQAFKLHLSWFHYTNITLILMAYLLLVFLSDKLSENLRKGHLYK